MKTALNTSLMNTQTRIALMFAILSLLALLAFHLLGADPPNPSQGAQITLTPQEATALAALIQRQNEDNAKLNPPGPIYTTDTFLRERLDQTFRDAIRSQPSVDRRNIQEDAAKLSPQDAAEVAALIRQKLGGGGGASGR